MNQKLAVFSVADLTVDPTAVEQALEKTCRRGRDRYRVRGVCQVENRVYFVLRPAPEPEPPESYVIVVTQDVTDAGMTGVLDERWRAGFDALGSVNLGGSVYLLVFAKPGSGGE